MRGTYVIVEGSQPARSRFRFLSRANGMSISMRLGVVRLSNIQNGVTLEGWFEQHRGYSVRYRHASLIRPPHVCYSIPLPFSTGASCAAVAALSVSNSYAPTIAPDDDNPFAVIFRHMIIWSDFIMAQTSRTFFPCLRARQLAGR